MVGIIWFVQIVHYPLFGRVGADNFVDYQNRHQRWTSWVAGPPMLVEAFTSVLLVWHPPIPNTALLLMGVGLLFVIWMSTLFLQIPAHGDLERGFVAKSHRGLVLTNWIRTIAWTLRGALMFWIAFTAFANLQN